MLEVMKKQAMPDAFKLVEGKDAMKVMRHVLNGMKKVLSTEVLKEEVRKGEMQVLNLMVAIVQQQAEKVMANIKQHVQISSQLDSSEENLDRVQRKLKVYEILSSFS